MPIIGAVLNLAEDPVLKSAAIDFLANDDRITLGELQLQGLPVVIDCNSRSEEMAIWDDLQAQSGILFCSIAYADFSDIEGEP
jgi:hypothetical protein